MRRRDQQLARRLQASLDRLEPALRRAVARALLRLQRRLSVDAIATAITTGDEFRLRALASGLSRDLEQAAGVLLKAFSTGQRHAVAQLPEGITASLNLTNPFVIRAAEQSAAKLVTGVSTDTRNAIRLIVQRSVSGDLTVRQSAQLIKPLIGLTERQALAVIRRRFQQTKRGVPAVKAAKDAERYAARLLTQRAEMIARTEIIRASTDGQLETWSQARQQGLIGPRAGKRWMVTPDDRLCPRCAPLEGEVRPLDGTFEGVDGPPLHPQCRCALVLVSDVKTSRGRVAA